MENLTSDGIDHNVLKRKLQIDIVRKIWGFKILSLQSTKDHEIIFVDTYLNIMKC